MSRTRPSAPGAAIRPLVSTPQGIWSAGVGFAIAGPDTRAQVFVSCLHLLGPAGGLPEPVTPSAFFTGRVPLVDAYDDTPLTSATGVLALPLANTREPWRDLFALLLPDGHGCHLYEHRRTVEVGESVTIAVPPHGDGPLAQPATVERVAGPLFSLRLDAPDRSPRGWSGAAVMDARARWVGMLVRGTAGRAAGVHASAVRVQLRQALEAATRSED